VQQLILREFAATGVPPRRDHPAVDMCCSYLNFRTDRASAQAWAATHPHIHGSILDQSSALALGEATFGPILSASAWASTTDAPP
jgi:hypothetical protein